MSEAVEGAELMLCGVSEKYKERCGLLALLVYQVMLLCSRLLCVVVARTVEVAVDQMCCVAAQTAAWS